MDYEEKYKEALERAKQFSEKPYLEDSKGIVEYIFPELKESEDERIRIWIRKELESKYVVDNIVNNVMADKALAWLEKQGEHNKFRDSIQVGDKVTRNEDGVLVNLSQLNRVAKKDEKQGEQKPVPDWMPKFLDELRSKKNYFDWDEHKEIEGGILAIINWMNPNYFNEKDGKQKPADLKTKAGNWYICDMEVMNENMATAFHRDEIYYCPKDGYLDVDGALFGVGCLNVFRLATKKEIPQPKQEWSEEDESHIRYLIECLEHCKKGVALTMTTSTAQEYIDWLKSPKSRYTWKPSDEHYELEEFAKIVRGNLTGISKAVQKLFEAKYLQLTGNKMYGGFKD